MRFKIDDIVKIVCADVHTCVKRTKEKIGQVGKIVKFSGVQNIPYSVSFEEVGDTMNFMEKEIVLDVKIGQQLEFSFMDKVT